MIEATIYSFRKFQDLPRLARETLISHYRGNQADTFISASESLTKMRDHYEDNYPRYQHLSIDEITLLVLSFISTKVYWRMVCCFVENDCSMMRAKLAWSEDY